MTLLSVRCESWRRLDKFGEDGWFLVATKGSHRQFKYAVKPGRVTVAGKLSDDLPPGTLNSILKLADWKKGAARGLF